MTEQLNHVYIKMDSDKGKIGIREASRISQTPTDNIWKPFFKWIVF